MKSNLKAILMTCLIFSIISMVLDMTLMIVKIIYRFTGFQRFQAPLCTVSSYLQLKLASISLSFKIATILSAFAFVLAIIILALLIQKLRKLNVDDQFDEQMTDSNLQEVTSKLFILVSLQLQCLLINAGTSISLITDNESCQIINSNIFTIVLIVANVAMIMTATLLILIIALNRRCSSQQKCQEGDHVNTTQLQRQEHQIQKQFQDCAKEYLSNNHNQKNELTNNLIQQGQDVYGNHQQMNSILSGSTSKKGIMKLESKKLMESLKDNEQEQIGNSKSDKTEKQNKENGQELSPSQIKEKRKKDTVAKMHQYYLNKPSQNSQQEDYCYNKQNYSNNSPNNILNYQEQAKILDMKENNRLKNTLIATDIDNLSDKFDENNFQLQNQFISVNQNNSLNLSPFELQELNHFTDECFQLKRKNEGSLTLQKDYIVFDVGKIQQYTIRINFIKIKNYKANLKKVQCINSQDEMEQSLNCQGQSTKIDYEHNKNMINITEDLLTQQTKKLIKLTFFQNFYQIQKSGSAREQLECPISKYVNQDEILEIRHSGTKFKKFSSNRQKPELENQQVIFNKKKKWVNNQIRFSRYEEQIIKKERQQIFGAEWIKQKLQQQQYRNGKVSHVKDKYQKVNCIRSKYQL